jgi:predicted dehydrogenase
MNTRPNAENRVVLFVGCGQAATLHSRIMARRFPEVDRLYHSRSHERAKRLAASVGGEALSGSLDAALAHERVDAVFVTTPPSTHVAVALEALDAGKHVVVEKPAFLDAGEFDQVETAARRCHKQVLVAENYFYKPVARRLRALVAQGVLGQVRFIEINAVKRQSAEGWRLDPALCAGGALFEGGIHWVSLMANLGLEVQAAHGFFPDAPPGHERSAVFVAEYAQGAVGVLTYSWEIPSALKGLRLSRIWGIRASILFESNGLFVLRSGRRPRLYLPASTDIQGYRAMHDDFMRALTTGQPPAFTLRAARRDVELVRSAYATASVSPAAYGRES